MPRVSPRILLLAVFILIVSLVYLAEVSSVPFHPDESTQIYMSSDFEIFFQQPSALFWQPEKGDSLRQHYRQLDPPFTHTWIGFVRWLTRQPELIADWDWSRSWQANQTAGALPEADLLQTGRLAVAILFPFTLAFVYLSGKQLGGEITGWSAIVLTASNALILLHTRRAMAEGWLVTGVAFSLWALFTWRKRPWLCAIPIALAFNAKYSAAPLLLVGIIAILWNPTEKNRTWRGIVVQLAAYLAIFGGITLLLNPFLWAHPFESISAAITARSNFMAAQSVDFSGASSLFAPQTIWQSLTAMLAQVFFTPPSFAEVSNYLAQTKPVVEEYLSNPLNNLLRGPVGGGTLLGFFLLGLITTLRRIFTPPRLASKRGLILILTALAFEFIFMLITTNVAFQRYYLVLLPMVILICSLGVASLIRFFTDILNWFRTTQKNSSGTV
ncbi:MAG TPA: hypothetical protein VN364_13765 [Bellilinea sp.]|nr:hypothetical protein [Bellilinea sp.]